jgi:hypothetical protein
VTGRRIRHQYRGLWTWVFAFLLFPAVFGFRAFAVVDANSRANTNAPADGSPWGNVGGVNGASAIYVGAGWVLTASHVGGGNAEFGGVIYPWEGSYTRLTNSDGTFTDLIVFHVQTLPPLPRIPLVSAAPSASSQVDLMGTGCIAGSAETNIGSYTGFYWSARGAKSWGNNQVNAGGTTTVNAGYGNVTVFSTTFSSTGQTSDEAQAAAGDSGGGVFQKSGSTWQLVGMLDLVSAYPGQTNATAVYGNVTYCANIATYRSQIAAALAGTVPSLSISRSGTNVTVCWVDSGVTYDLYGNRDLSTTNWALLSPSLTLTNGQYCGLLPATNSPTFFRLKKQ